MENETKEYLSVGELAARSGVAISAIHFYETKGLIRSSRNSQNHRKYPRGILRVIALIKVAQTLGFSLDEIHEMFEEFPIKGKPTEEDWKHLSKKWRAELENRSKLLEKLKKQLDFCIGCGCLLLKDCPLRNKNDKLSKKGAGPQILIPG